MLPTQLLAKVVDPSLDARAIQKGWSRPGAFDARTIAHKVIVPFDRANNNVLGGSTEPYANNPLRIPAIEASERSAQKNKAGFDDLLLVLEYTQTHPGKTRLLFECVLFTVKERLQQVAVSYPVPNRVGFEQAQACVVGFLAERSGGVRLQAVGKALFVTIGKRFGLFNSAVASVVNAADASTGAVADIECLDAEGRIVIAAEVKDRELTIRHLQDKLPAIRRKSVSEFIFLIQGGVESGSAETIADAARQQFSSGHNLYVCEFDSFLATCLVLLAEEGRKVFIAEVGLALDEQRAGHEHRRRWSELVAAL